MNLNKKLYEIPNRHMGNKYPWFLKYLQKDRIRVEYVPTVSIKAIRMTKSLERMKHTKFCRYLGLRKIGPGTDQPNEMTQSNTGSDCLAVQGEC